MAANQRRPGMVDVARAAGVAHVTVSRVLNNHPSVRPATRERVLRAIEDLGYRRNNVARALKSGNSKTIGVVIAGSELFELPKVLSGVEAAARRAGYWVNLASWQGGTAADLASTVDRLTDQAAEGIAIIADRPVAVTQLEQMVTRVPVSVVMSGDVQNIGVTSVELDQRLGASLVVGHLHSHGHRDIVHLSGRLDVYDARARLDGWREAMAAQGFADAEWYEGDFTAKSGYELAMRLVDEQDLPTAIFTGNDQMAMGVFAAFAQAGVHVPNDVSVVGFDDITGADFLVPSLTTVRQDFVALGSTSIERLVANIDGEAAAHHLIEPTLVPRASSAAPRS